MADPQQVLAQRVHDAIVASFGPEYGDADPLIRPSSFADFQANVALPLGKRLGRPPREVAGELARHGLMSTDMCAAPEVSGPGFINLRLRDDWIAAQASQMLNDPRLGLAPVATPQTVVVEYSSPNIAKEMHVGHLRTTIVGDAIARVLEFAGHRVIRDNHVGDWGTQFGMLIEHLLDVGEDSAEAGLLRTDPNAFYQAARRKFDTDPGFAERARKRLVDLQGGDPATLQSGSGSSTSQEYLHRIYAGSASPSPTTTSGARASTTTCSRTRSALLEAKGMAVYSDGALCAFPPGFTGREGRPLPLIIRKSDGGYNYASTDLATIRYRVDELGCDRAIYVVGADQALHFQMVFAVAREAGWIPVGASFEHAQIGLVLGPDGNRLRTRSGDNVQLSDLLAEGVERARGILAELEATARFSPAELDQIAEAVGIGAVKYADLSTARESGYVFDWDRMISFRGNTGPYLQYATARIRSIFRRSGEAADPGSSGSAVRITAPPERALALRLLDFGAAISQLGQTTEPHRLCAFLFDVASLFTTFYEECPVLKAEPESLRAARLALCALTLRVLTTGLDLLGVPVPEQM